MNLVKLYALRKGSVNPRIYVTGGHGSPRILGFDDRSIRSRRIDSQESYAILTRGEYPRIIIKEPSKTNLWSKVKSFLKNFTKYQCQDEFEELMKINDYSIERR